MVLASFGWAALAPQPARANAVPLLFLAYATTCLHVRAELD